MVSWRSAFDRASVDIDFQTFLQSLHFPAIESRREEIADAHKETFQWIFDDSGDAVRPWSNFVEWLETGRGTYWLVFLLLCIIHQLNIPGSPAKRGLENRH